MKLRFLFLILFFMVLYGLLGIQLYRLQIKEGEGYFEKVEAQTELIKELRLRRGQIFFTDKEGTDIPVALNKDYPIVYAAPKEIVSGTEETVSAFLTEKLGVSREAVNGIFEHPESSYRLLLERASREQVNAVQTSGLRGVYFDYKQYRFYPNGAFASALLGFYGVNERHPVPVGLSGVEKYYEDLLADGKDIRLTVDKFIQAAAEEILRRLLEKFSSSRGTVIVEEPKTGKILAFANAPNFDPNRYGEYPVETFINPGVSFVYEPGSVFKPITMAAGIETGAITPETTYTDTGSVTVNGKTIRNWDNKAHGTITMTEVIEKSVNTGAVFAESKIGHEPFLSFLKRLRFGEPTGIDVPGEVSGSLANLESGAREIDFATASFGQGQAVTPIQLVNVFSAIANGGLLMRPYVNQAKEPYVVARVMEPDTARKVSEMMESAVTKARIAAIPGFRIAGKTGTAQVPDFSRGGYTDEYIHTFIGFAPVSDPRFVILIKLDKPSAELAGYTVVPAFRELAQFILNYYNIAPDKLPVIH